jgi:hypothetical protein
MRLANRLLEPVTDVIHGVAAVESIFQSRHERGSNFSSPLEKPMKRMVLESWLLLLYFDLVMNQGNFKALHDTVRKYKVNPLIRNTSCSAEALCHTVDLACVFYFKPVMCLQRSATTVLLLRRYGWNAEMVIGAQRVSLKSHAWVEIAGTIVNDKPYMLDIYQVLERC